MKIARNFPCLGAIALLGVAAGCSDPVPPAAQGAVSLYMGPAQMGTCSAGSHYVNAPYVPRGGPQTSATQAIKDAPSKAVDGEGGMAVSCTVKPNGNKFSFVASLSVPAIDTTGKTVAPTSVGLRADVGADDEAGSGSVTLIDDKTGTAYQATGCVFSTKPGTNENLGIDKGKIWAKVTCGDLRDPKNPSSTPACQIQPGYFIFENCRDE